MAPCRHLEVILEERSTELPQAEQVMVRISGYTPPIKHSGILVLNLTIASEAGSSVSDVRKRQSKKDEVCDQL